MAPLLYDNGDINSAKGYDKATGLWCTGAVIPQIPDRPDLANAKQALGLLRAAFASMPFGDAKRRLSEQRTLVDLPTSPGADESALLVAVVTAICRPSLPLAPAVLIPRTTTIRRGNGEGTARPCNGNHRLQSRAGRVHKPWARR
jgi:hypothetical protein